MGAEFARYIVKRIGFAVLMLVGVSLLLFTIMHLAPGGPEAVLVGADFSQEAAAQIRQRLGLDRPILIQYGTWAFAALRGDFGRSFKTGDPVVALIRDRLGPTLQLTAGALTLALVVSVPKSSSRGYATKIAKKRRDICSVVPCHSLRSQA